MATIQTLAALMYAALVEDTRTDGQTFYKFADGSPEWFTEVTRAAHGDLLPDDTRYSMIRECLDRLQDADADDDADALRDSVGEWADALVDVYNRDRLTWLASHLERASYCDEARESGLVAEDADLFTRIGIGQYTEYEEILHSLIASLAERAEEENNASDDAKGDD